MKKHALPPLPILDWNDDDYDAAYIAPQKTPTEQPYVPQYFDDAIQALGALAPEGSTVCPIGFDDVEMFLRAGYRVTERAADVTIARGGCSEFALAHKRACKKLVLCPTRDYAAAATSAYLDSDGAFGVI